jgi:serine O-acetyltransferase
MKALQADIRRYRGDFPRRRLSLVGLMIRRPSLQVIAVYRLGQWLRRRRHLLATACLRPLCWFLYAPLRELVGGAYGIHLHPTAEIGPGLYIGHVGGVDVRHCTIGAHCSIAQQTRIGPASTGGDGPVIGNRVWIGAHAQLVGAITVGDGATVAAGAHLSRDVPAGSLVAGNPARVVKWFYDNTPIIGIGPGTTLGRTSEGQECRDARPRAEGQGHAQIAVP